MPTLHRGHLYFDDAVPHTIHALAAAADMAVAKGGQCSRLRQTVTKNFRACLLEKHSFAAAVDGSKEGSMWPVCSYGCVQSFPSFASLAAKLLAACLHAFLSLRIRLPSSPADCVSCAP